jgi:hypothetical protein
MSSITSSSSDRDDISGVSSLSLETLETNPRGIPKIQFVVNMYILNTYIPFFSKSKSFFT